MQGEVQADTQRQARPPRLSARQLVSEITQELFSLDRGLPWTFGQLLSRPGATVRRYIEWRDPRLTRPSRLLLLVLTMAALLWQIPWLGLEVESGIADGMGAAEAGRDALVSRALQAVQGHFDLWLVISWVPAAGAAMQRSFRPSQLNLAEAVVVGFYTLCLFIPLQLGLLIAAAQGWLSPRLQVWFVLSMPFWLMLWVAFDFERKAWRALACALWMQFFLAVTLIGTWSFVLLIFML